MTAVHKATWTILRPLVSLFLRIKFGYRYKRPEQLPENYIVLANHATNFDPLFVAVAFPQMYLVGSEHISRWGFASKLLKIFFAPILRPKGSVAAHTVKEILQTLRSGKNVCLFAEGSCSWDGRPNPILPSTGKMVQKAHCGLVTYRLMGGFFAQPRWGTSGTRKGYLRGEPMNVYTAEQLAAMSADEINAAIRRDLGEDAYVRQLANPRLYKSKRSAEGLEYLMYTCPTCGGIETFRTQGDTVECIKCGLKFRYNEYGMLDGIPFDTLRDYGIWQEGQTGRDAEDGKSYTTENATLVRVMGGVTEEIGKGALRIGPDGICCGQAQIPLADISELDIHSKNVIVFTAGKAYYELSPEGNGYKYFLLHRHYSKAMQEAVSVR